jgi:hypothetical protein
MRKAKQIFVFFFLAAMVLATTTGFAFYTIRCQFTGDTYHSVIDKKCCCEIPKEIGEKCCDEESLTVKVDTQAALKEFNVDLNPLSVAAVFTQLIDLSFPAEYKVDYLNYFEHSHPLPEQKIIILVQSFLL